MIDLKHFSILEYFVVAYVFIMTAILSPVIIKGYKEDAARKRFLETNHIQQYQKGSPEWKAREASCCHRRIRSR
jgi:hypothetical protein